MIKAGQCLAGLTGALIVSMLATSGCASKKYVTQHIAPVNERLNQYEKQTNDRLAWLNNKQQTEFSQLNERITTTDQNVATAAAAAQSAQGSAARAMDDAAANTTAIDHLETSLSNYKLLDKQDVLFGFNKATLTPEAQTMLDAVIVKVQASPRSIVELAGFTDPIGTPTYNLDLSRRRAWAVQRYLVEHDVPLRAIHIVGLGEGRPPADFAADNTGTSRNERNRMDRRVNVRIYEPSEVSSSTSTGSR